MDFEFSPEQLAFVKEVETFLDANDDPEVFDLTGRLARSSTRQSAGPSWPRWASEVGSG